MSYCAASAYPNYPHHYRCAYVVGHPNRGCDGLTCTGKCKSWQCTLRDGTHRVPDGSIAAKAHLEAGGKAVFKGRDSQGKADVLLLPKV